MFYFKHLCFDSLFSIKKKASNETGNDMLVWHQKAKNLQAACEQVSLKKKKERKKRQLCQMESLQQYCDYQCASLDSVPERTNNKKKKLQKKVRSILSVQ